MSRLRKALAETLATDTKILPHGVRALAVQATDAERQVADAQASAARASYADTKSRWAPVKEAEAKLALAKVKLEQANASQIAARHAAGFADLELSKARATVEGAEIALRKQLIPAYQLIAARRLLQRERERFEQGAPLSKPVNQANAKPRDWTRNRQQLAFDEAVAIIAKALGDLDHFEAGIIEPPRDFSVWVDAVCNDAEARLPATGQAA